MKIFRLFPQDSSGARLRLFAILLLALIWCLVGWRYCYKPGARDGASSTTADKSEPNEPVATPFHASPADGLPRCSKQKMGGVSLDQVDDNVYVMVKSPGGNSDVPMKNISWIVTDGGVVMIDTGVLQSALIAKTLIQKTTDKPIMYIIYTHNHGTNVLGTGIFKTRSTKVIAQEDFVLEFERAVNMPDYFNRINSIQFDVDPMIYDKDQKYDALLPDLTYQSEYEFTLGQTRFHLYHAVGEAADYSIIFMPDQKIVWTGDMTGFGVPNVASPMKPVRDAIRWKKALELIKSLDPDVLIGSVAEPVCDKRQIAIMLEARINYLDFLHKAVANELNQGSTLEETLENTKLPPPLAHHPLLQDLYLSHEFNVRGLFQMYSGWFDQNGSHLKPAPSKQRAESFIRDMGGAQKVLDRAGGLRAAKDLKLALEYLDLLIAAGERSSEAHRIKSAILDEMSLLYEHKMTANMYRYLAKIELQQAAQKSSEGANHSPRSISGTSGK